MPVRPSITDESVFRRWMSLEIGKVNDGIVAERKYLAQLLSEDEPSAVTKAGEDYFFDKTVIEKLGEALPETLHFSLKLPILFFFSFDVRESYLITDEPAVRALKILGELGEMRRMIDGKLWVSRAIVYAIMKKYPTVIQIVMR